MAQSACAATTTTTTTTTKSDATPTTAAAAVAAHAVAAAPSLAGAGGAGAGGATASGGVATRGVTLPLAGHLGVTLRRFRRDDHAELVRNANNPKIARNLRDVFPSPYTDAEGTAWLDMQLAAKPPNQHLVIDVDGKYAGGISVMPLADVHSKDAELGYWLGEDYWGRGIATEAVRLMLIYAFGTFDLIRVHAGCFDRNAASARVLIKSGFVLEGRLRSSVVKNGVVLDQLLHSILREEHKALCSNTKLEHPGDSNPTSATSSHKDAT